MKTVHGYIKTLLASGVRKSVSEESTFIKFNLLAFSLSGFLDLTKFDFFDLVNFIIVDRFLISVSPLTSPYPLDASCFFSPQ